MSKKTAVIYKTKYGSTKKYAGWIALKLNADLYEVTDIRPKHLLEYDMIVFGGGLYRGKISGINFIKDNYDKIKDKKLFLFSVGMESINEDKREIIIKQNLNKMSLENIKIYNFKGEYEYKTLNFLDKIMMKALKKTIENKGRANFTQDDLTVLKGFEEKVNLTDKQSINKLIEDISQKTC
ncbi:MAG: flavodoxin domain-containing protein [Paraclostridium sp.]|uniref:flavodoxin domain-containing protein n=1 Tax=Paraclostridium sp. TaxID=2023273 RepID=UPI003F407F8E